MTMKNIISLVIIYIFLPSGIQTIQAQRPNYKVNVATYHHMKVSKPTFENVSIYRLQLRFKTGSMKYAGTNSPVYVIMNDTDDAFYLDLSKDDREKGKTDVYDIMSTSINKIKDLEKLVIGISDDDAWNMEQVEILVNNAVIFKRKFRGRQSWIGGKHGKYKFRFELTHAQLRNSSYWGYSKATKNIYKAPATIPVKMIKSQMECLMGNAIEKQSGFSWGKKYGKEYVSVKRVDDFTVSVDLDLKQRGFMNLKDSETDVDFDIEFKYVNGRLKVNVKNLDIDFSDYGHLSTKKRDLYDTLNGKSKRKNWIKNIGLLQIQEFYDIDFTYSKTTTARNTCGNGIVVMSNGDICLGNNKGISERRTRIN